jgi:hypothetical protein
MGLPFPVYSPEELPPDAQQRAALKAEIIALVQTNDQVKDILQPCLDKVRPVLRSLTDDLMQGFRRRPVDQ